MTAPRAGIVLAGGRSTRMGVSKATLEWGGTSLAAHVAAVVAAAVDGPVVVVRAQGQELPPLPAGVETAQDGRPGRGPLEALVAGLRTVGPRAEAVYVSSVDVPLLRPAFVAAVLEGLDEAVDAAVPRADGRPYPLAAAYRTSVRGAAERLLAADRLRMTELLDALRVRWLGPGDLARIDGSLDSLVNVNTRDDLEKARSSSGAPPQPSAIRSGCA